MRCAPRAAHERASSARAMFPRHHFESELRAGRARPRSLADIGLWQREHQLVAASGPRLHVLQGAARPEADRASCHRVRCATLVWA